MIKEKKKLGIIGGMGPLAAAFFYRAVVEHTEALSDQEHIITYMISDPTIPKRVEYILGENSESPLGALIKTAEKLEEMGAEIIAMPCVTAHFFYEKISASVSVPMINMLDETVRYLKIMRINSAGILATRATIKSAIVQTALEKAGIEAILPEEEENEIISRVIFEEIKKGKKADTDSLLTVMDSMIQRGAGKCLIACTDLSVCFYEREDERYVDMMKLLAQACVERVNGGVRNI